MLQLTDEELDIYSVWAGVIRASLARDGVRSSEFRVIFTFADGLTGIVAHCTAYADDSKDLVIRSCANDLT